MSNLEPCIESENTIILNELEEVNEIYFFLTGKFEIGFDLNSK
jgi:hypothetical protein